MIGSPDREISSGSVVPCNIRRVTMEELDGLWKAPTEKLSWRCLFTLPPWLDAWWTSFGEGLGLCLLLAEDSEGVIGVVPLQIHGDTAMLVGSANVCDYLDVTTVPGRERDVCHTLFDYLENEGIRELVLHGVRQDAVVWTHLAPVARALGWETTCQQEGVSFEIGLPATWDVYLQSLKGKQRHELRRKLRRLREAGHVRFRVIDSLDGVREAFSTFLDLFKAARGNKAAFMSPQMTKFFRTLAANVSPHGMLKMGLMEIDGATVSAVMCFDHRSIRYLYNSGYAPDYPSLSVGLLCKVLSIQDAMANGLSCYDLLKGEEVYKQRLGGQPKRIFKCRIRRPG